jgi:curved DNA-binding protein CbpA
VPAITNRSHYEVLGVKPTAHFLEIKAAFRKLSLDNHPDKTQHLHPDERNDRTERLKVINNAYEVLRDQQSRKWYDEHEMGQRASHDPEPEGDDTDDEYREPENTARGDEDTHRDSAGGRRRRHWTRSRPAGEEQRFLKGDEWSYRQRRASNNSSQRNRQRGNRDSSPIIIDSDDAHSTPPRRSTNSRQRRAREERRAQEERAAAEKQAQEERAAAEKQAQEERAAAEKQAQERAAVERRAQEEERATEKRAAEKQVEEDREDAPDPTRKRKRRQHDDEPSRRKTRRRRPGFLGDFSSNQSPTRADQYSFPTPRYNVTEYLVKLGPQHFVYERALTHLRALGQFLDQNEHSEATVVGVVRPEKDRACKKSTFAEYVVNGILTYSSLI